MDFWAPLGAKNAFISKFWDKKSIPFLGKFLGNLAIFQNPYPPPHLKKKGGFILCSFKTAKNLQNPSK